uniref:Uncharacterized protein n=1 Tax=Lactuca sativa TaxID=4236 RepID=A0A9R1XXA9_LACSA|nr:hypothetical protein LSAT_V11C200075370 [Lactuca sativa]
MKIDLVKWIDKTFDLKVSQGTISNILKRSSEFLLANFDKDGSSKRHKAAKYPNMERDVYEDIRKLENLLTGMHYQHKMDVNELLDYPGENNECYEVQSIEELIADVVQNSVDDDSVPLEPVTRKKPLQAATTLHNFLLQYANTVSQLLSTIGKFKDKLNIDLKLTKLQMTIDSFFTRQLYNFGIL